jgi:hypothetical protein
MLRSVSLLTLFLASFAHSQEVKLLRSLSGPSGHSSGATFIFDEIRSRFVYPQEKTFIVYFEWAAPPGLHTINAAWKSPNGPASISPDIKVDLADGPLSAYWTFTIHPGDPSGVWTLDARVDGAPAGSHNFELFVPAGPAPSAKPPRPPTTDEIYQGAAPSLVIVSSVNAAGEKVDRSLGFVYAQDRVATSFQSIDGATTLSIAFADGRNVVADSLSGFSRSSDWAIVSVPTSTRRALKVAPSSNAKVGEKVMAFTMDNDKDPVAAVVEVVGRAKERIRFNPPLPPVSAGSPVLDAEGRVIGIVGAWMIPGSRIPHVIAVANPAVWTANENTGAMTPIEAVSGSGVDAGPDVTLRSLRENGTLTPAMVRFPSLTFATTTDLPAKRSELPDRTVTEFSRRNPGLVLVSLWQRHDKTKAVLVSTAIYDVANRKRGEVPAKKVSLGDSPYRVTQSIGLAGVEPGSYRIDLMADGGVVWRTFVRVVE